MKRPLFNLLTALSLALCVVASAGWVASYYGPVRDSVSVEAGDRRATLYRGDLWLDNYLPDHPPGPDHDWGWNCADLVAYRHFWGRREEWTTSLVRLPAVAATGRRVAAAPQAPAGQLPPVRVRPPRHARPVPGMRYNRFRH